VTVPTATPYPTPVPPSYDAGFDPGYHYTIITTIDQTYDFAQNCTVHFKFSRPVFSGSSPLVDAANAAFDQAESDYKSKMQQAMPSSSDMVGINEDQYFTETTSCTFEFNLVVSFVLHMSWWMGGVENSSNTGFTFDFAQNKQLKIADILYGTDDQIQQALVDAVYYQYIYQHLGDGSAGAFASQSGPDADFYLVYDGVHVFYQPYTINATQDGIDILLPWSRTDLVRSLNTPG